MSLVKAFHANTSHVSLMAAAETVAQEIKENYAGFVTPGLLKKWVDDPVNAPGRASSSPWPERIEVSGINKLSETEYEVKGTEIWVTSIELTSGGAAQKRPVVLNVIQAGDEWKISNIVFGEWL